MSRSRNWVFTLNANEDEGQHIRWITPSEPCPVGAWLDSGKIDYLVCQVEHVGHYHVQGYIQFNCKMTLAACKKINKEAHWEPRRGTHQQAKDYCMKEDSRVSGPWELGHEKGDQGSRNDLEAIAELVKAKKTNLEIVESVGASASKFAKHIQFLRFTFCEAESDRQLQGVKVIILYGPSGSGKTYAAVNFLAGGHDYYICEAPSHAQSKVWFDGYEGQKTLILDDFEGSFCAYRFLLRLMDCYKLKVEYKGGHCWAVWTTLVITTNIFPLAWYKDVNLEPLKRRVTELRYMEARQDADGEPLFDNCFQLMDWNEKPLPDKIVFEKPQEGQDEIDPPATPHSPQIGLVDE